MCNEVGVTREGAYQSNLETEIMGQNGQGHYKPLKIWGYLIPKTKEFTFL